MKKITIEMSEVRKCGVTDCAYNRNAACHAKAITVGDAIEPDCDTFLVSAAHTSLVTVQAGVGACKVTQCQFNKDFECAADSIQVDYSGNRARCMTFKP